MKYSYKTMKKQSFTKNQNPNSMLYTWCRTLIKHACNGFHGAAGWMSMIFMLLPDEWAWFSSYCRMNEHDFHVAAGWMYMIFMLLPDEWAWFLSLTHFMSLSFYVPWFDFLFLEGIKRDHWHEMDKVSWWMEPVPRSLPIAFKGRSKM